MHPIYQKQRLGNMAIVKLKCWLDWQPYLYYTLATHYFYLIADHFKYMTIPCVHNQMHCDRAWYHSVKASFFVCGSWQNRMVGCHLTIIKSQHISLISRSPTCGTFNMVQDQHYKKHPQQSTQSKPIDPESIHQHWFSDGSIMSEYNIGLLPIKHRIAIICLLFFIL